MRTGSSYYEASYCTSTDSLQWKRIYNDKEYFWRNVYIPLIDTIITDLKDRLSVVIINLLKLFVRIFFCQNLNIQRKVFFLWKKLLLPLSLQSISYGFQRGNGSSKKILIQCSCLTDTQIYSRSLQTWSLPKFKDCWKFATRPLDSGTSDRSFPKLRCAKI